MLKCQSNHADRAFIFQTLARHFRTFTFQINHKMLTKNFHLKKQVMYGEIWYDEGINVKENEAA